ncbi:hypothetical protein EDC30_11093 [Paucimonas lemoignei]|uniref:Phospholipase D-like domain-containing protein n=1 Tax=Paucimonas lemoignei TaxID=29443 RepID=A0A4R3HSI8_PAULE|nr:hypothetical protein [Paucimonas lemoignei]TCS35624.1 hypothetical protein EDC30_11093 [Paucimonas lemoignei]
MTLEFLTQSPTNTETKQKLSTIVKQKTEGRIFLLTGNVSAQRNDIAADMLLSLIEWAAESKNRELVIWVGVWVDFNAVNRAREEYVKSNPGKSPDSFKYDENEYLTTHKVADDLANLYVQAERKYMDRKPSPPVITPTIQFWGVKKWHAKALGLSGKGKEFKDAQCAIFGSTNFSANALGGKSFELDLYMDTKTETGGALLDAFIRKIVPLLDEAKTHNLVPDFQNIVFLKIAEWQKKRS